jgi:hypothetical protein
VLLSFAIPPIVASFVAVAFKAEHVGDLVVFSVVGGWFPFTSWLVDVFGGTEQPLPRIAIVVMSYSGAFLALAGPLTWGAVATARAAPSRLR